MTDLGPGSNNGITQTTSVHIDSFLQHGKQFARTGHFFFCSHNSKGL